MCVWNSDQSSWRKKYQSGKKILLLLFFRSSHTHPERERETWSLPLLLACVSVAFEHPLRLVLRPLPDRHGLRKMNKESGNELLIKLSNSKEGKDWTLLFYYYLPTILMILGWFLKICLSNTRYIMLILRFWFYVSNIWNVRLTLVLSNSKRKGKKELWAKINTTTTNTCLGNICERGKNKQIASSHNRILRKLYKHKFSLI